MSEYKHYIRVDSNNIVIDGYADWQEDKRADGEIALQGEFGRHFQIQLRNERGQCIYKLLIGAMVARTQEELDVEWNSRPPAPKTEMEIVKEENAQLTGQVIELWETLIGAGVL